MKKRFLTLVLLIIVFQKYASAQEKPDSSLNLSKAFLHGGFGFGTGQMDLTFRWSLTAVSNGWGAIVDGYAVNADEIKYPSDYQRGGLGLNFGNSNNYNDMKFVNIRAIREWTVSASGIRLGVEAGPSFAKYEALVFTPIEPGQGFGWFFTPSNYNVSNKTDNTVGGSIRAKALFPLARVVALEGALVNNFNSIRNYFGAEFMIHVGIVRKKKS